MVAAAWEAALCVFVCVIPSPFPGKSSRVSRLQARPVRLLFSTVGFWWLEFRWKWDQGVPATAPLPSSLICSVVEAWEGSGIQQEHVDTSPGLQNGSEIWHLREAALDGKSQMFALERSWGQAEL